MRRLIVRHNAMRSSSRSFGATRRRWAPLLGLAICAAVAGPQRPAAASENYPGVLDAQAAARTGATVNCGPAVRRCRICHDTASGGEGTANQPFALGLKDEFGLSKTGKAARALQMILM